MVEILQNIQLRLQAGEYKNEEHVRLSLVARVVQLLGWDIWNPTEVFTEFKATEAEDNTRVDVALFANNFAADAIFIECKAVGKIGEDLAKVERQLRDYNRNHSALFTLITDGQHWRFYYALTAGEFSQKLFARFDLLKDDLVDAAETLQRFLSRAAVLDGSARHAAESYLLLSRKERVMKDVLPEAEKCITQPPYPALPDALVNLLAAKRLVVSREEAVAFLAGDVLPKPAAAEPLIKLPAQQQSVANEEVTKATHSSQVLLFELLLNRSGVRAVAVLLADRRMHMQAGSTAIPTAKASLTANSANLRKKLQAEGALISDGKLLRFARDVVFSSAAQAADIICGYSVNARQMWKDANGKILGDHLSS